MTTKEAIGILEARCEGNELSEEAFYFVLPVIYAAAKLNKERAYWCLSWSENNHPDTLESQHGINRVQWMREMDRLMSLTNSLPDKDSK